MIPDSLQNMKVFIERTNKTRKISFNGSVKELLMHLDVSPVTALVIKNNELVTEKDRVKDTDEIKILSVVSGG